MHRSTGEGCWPWRLSIVSLTCALPLESSGTHPPLQSSTHLQRTGHRRQSHESNGPWGRGSSSLQQRPVGGVAEPSPSRWPAPCRLVGWPLSERARQRDSASKVWSALALGMFPEASDASDPRKWRLVGQAPSRADSPRPRPPPGPRFSPAGPDGRSPGKTLEMSSRQTLASKNLLEPSSGGLGPQRAVGSSRGETGGQSTHGGSGSGLGRRRHDHRGHTGGCHRRLGIRRRAGACRRGAGPGPLSAGSRLSKIAPCHRSTAHQTPGQT